mgnify:CR=1 FL=1
MSKNLLSADDASFESTVLESDAPVLVDFWAGWCAPCLRQAPILESFAAEHPEVHVVKVDVDASPMTAASYGIRSIPTLAVFIDGKPMLGAAGLQSEARLAELIDLAKEKAVA